MSVVFNEVSSYTVVTCCSCGVHFGMPQLLQQHRLNDGGCFYCPNGHPQGYTEPRVKALERQVQAERRLRDQAEAAAREAKKEAGVERAKAARLRKRVGHGTCPCCKRTFRQLARHMSHKHPEYVAGATEGAK